MERSHEVFSTEERYEVTTTTRQEWFSSNCTGRKKALLIGINYTGTDSALDGCHSDVDRMYQFLTVTYGFTEDAIVVLKDHESLEQEYQPTRNNMLYWMRWLVEGAEPHDSLFFHYSGHGGQREDREGDEIDYYDECIYPLDSIALSNASDEEIRAAARNVLVDDVLHKVLVSPLPMGTRLTAIFDSCHSGSVLDLPFVYAAASGRLKEGEYLDDEDKDHEAETGWMRKGRGVLGLENKEVLKVKRSVFEVKDMLEATKSILYETGQKLFVEGDNEGALTGLERLHGVKAHVKKVEEMQKTDQSLADVILISGCKDTQVSADATEDGVPTGALSWGFMSSLKEDPEPTYFELLNKIRDKLRKEKYAQLPQLSSGHPMDLNTGFLA